LAKKCMLGIELETFGTKVMCANHYDKF
jgi:hypothetical protein